MERDPMVRPSHGDGAQPGDRSPETAAHASRFLDPIFPAVKNNKKDLKNKENSRNDKKYKA
jgi:hypothetical protein